MEKKEIMDFLYFRYLQIDNLSRAVTKPIQDFFTKNENEDTFIE